MMTLLQPYPLLLPPLLAALNGDREATSTFFLDPSTGPLVINLCQQYGQERVLGPLFQASCAWIWGAHRTRMRLLGFGKVFGVNQSVIVSLSCVSVNPPSYIVLLFLYLSIFNVLY
jgi:hypothetical protein